MDVRIGPCDRCQASATVEDQAEPVSRISRNSVNVDLAGRRVNCRALDAVLASLYHEKSPVDPPRALSKAHARLPHASSRPRVKISSAERSPYKA